MKKYRYFSLSRLSAELRRRKVYPVIAAYGVGSWILLQIGEVTFEPLNMPDWAMTALIAVVVLGFPVALGLAWVFDIKPSCNRHDRISRRGSAQQDDQPSIAVLPFVDMSPEQDQGYFCEGVAEEILNALTTIPQLRVAARTSSFRFSSNDSDVRDIGRQLDVKAILEGSVRKSDTRLRVTAQLVKVADGYHLWSKRFDEELEDVFAIQDEIASSIAKALVETITSQDETGIRTTSSTDVPTSPGYRRGVRARVGRLCRLLFVPDHVRRP